MKTSTVGTEEASAVYVVSLYMRFYVSKEDATKVISTSQHVRRGANMLGNVKLMFRSKAANKR